MARRCRDCRNPKNEAKAAAAAFKPSDALKTIPEQHGLKLWKHVVFGTGTCVQMIEGYAKEEMPGADPEQIQLLIVRLNAVVDLLKSQQ